MTGIVIVAVSLALLLAQDSRAQAQCPEIPYYMLVPFDYPCQLHPRVCRTDYGLCRLGVWIKPGAPCQCQASNRLWYQGICIR